MHFKTYYQDNELNDSVNSILSPSIDSHSLIKAPARSKKEARSSIGSKKGKCDTVSKDPAPEEQVTSCFSLSPYLSTARPLSH